MMAWLAGDMAQRNMMTITTSDSPSDGGLWWDSWLCHRG